MTFAGMENRLAWHHEGRVESAPCDEAGIKHGARLGEAARGAPARHILVVEDVHDLAEQLAAQLREVASKVSVCPDGDSALESVRLQQPDLVLLDVGLPGTSGLEVCRVIRAEGYSMPVLMLSGRGGDLDRIVGLEFGADDYIVKPFNMLELLARVRAQFRRVALGAVDRPKGAARRIVVDDLIVDPVARQVTRGSHVLGLTEKEFDLFHLFAANPGRVYSRGQLLDLVWGCGSGVYEYTVTTHINRMRHKIERDPAHPEVIQTVWGLGYRLNAHGR